MHFLEVNNISKTYENGLVEALRGVSFTVEPGEFVALMGPSGCGKSTLLNIIGYLDLPTHGHISIGGISLQEQGPAHVFRAKTVGFVFQFHHLVSSMTLVENVEAPMIALGVKRPERRLRALKLLDEMGLGHRADFLPNRVSGGERQRAALARAMINSPKLLLVDEPTGNLDTATGEAVVQLMLSRSRLTETTIIIATHNPEIASTAGKIIVMRDGILIE
jgi:ABC-type lipoprotein export system ATPase subunit